MNPSQISNLSFLGKILRFPLRLIPKNTILPIIQGKLKGKFWVVGSGNHGYWLGSYEYEKQKIFSNLIKKDSVVFDIGAHAGFYSILASVLTGPCGKIVAFEPSPKNVEYLKKHRALNKLKNIRIIEAAVSDAIGRARFQTKTDSFATSHLSESGNIEIQTSTVDSLVLAGEIPPPDCLKIDVEGAENKVLKGARQTLTLYQPTIFLSTHSPDLRSECLKLLIDHNYHIRSIDAPDAQNASEFLAIGNNFI